jgi:uncharacterized membrane protein YfcA
MFPLILLSGFISGIAMGLVGIGGGAILMPLLLFSGLTLAQAVSVILFTHIVPQTLPGLIIYYNQGHFLFKESILVVIGSLIGTTLGAYMIKKNYIPKKILYYLMVATLLVLATWVFIEYC